MYQQTYYVEKSSGTYADIHAAYGLAAILAEVLARARGRESPHGVRLADKGPYFEVTFDGGPLTEAEVNSCPFFSAPGATGYAIAGGRAKPGDLSDDMPQRNVDETWEAFRFFRARRSELFDQGLRGTDLENQLRDAEPPLDSPIVAWLGDGRMQAQGINNQIVALWCQTKEYFTTNLRTMLRICATPEPDLETIAADWSKATGFTRKSQRTVTSSQLFNPHQGKGLNQPKANRLVMDNVKDTFWLLEYLKVCGLWLTTVPRQVLDRDWKPTGERKTYVISPLQMALSEHLAVFREFSRRIWHLRRGDATSLKLDITSILLYVKTLMDYGEAAQRDEESDFGIQFDACFGPEQVVGGLHMVQYKLLSQQAYTVTHMGFLGLPHWTAGARNREDVYTLKDIIDEHLRVIWGIDESHSVGFDLLRRYRNFVAGGQWDAFFDFTLGYSNYLIRQVHAGQRPWSFSVDLLRRLMMNAEKNDKSLTAVIESVGFHNIAYAIRHSTIVPQGQLARSRLGEGEKPLYQVRYGLGQSLKQKANDRKEFLAALGDFLSIYSAETYQIFESKGQRRRRDIHRSDIDEVARLVVDFGPEVVCNMLVAYGYASDFSESKSSGE